MLRRLLIFAVLMAGGFALLSLLIEGPMWNEEDPGGDIRTAPPTGVEIAGGGLSETGQRKPGLKIAGSGNLTLRGRLRTYAVGGGKELDLPSYEVQADEHRIRPDGRYELEAVRVTFPRPMRVDGRIERGSPVELLARNLRLSVEGEGELRRIDESQEMELADVRLEVRLEGLQGREVLDGEARQVLRLETAQLSGFLRDEVLEVFTHDEREPVLVTVAGPDGDLEVRGRGVRSRWDTGPLADSELSELRLLDRIEIQGTGKLRFEADADGPLAIRGSRRGDGYLELEKRVRMRVSGTPDGGEGLEGECERLGVWLLSGRVPGDEHAEFSRLPSALVLEGSPSRLRQGDQSLEARRIDIGLDPWGRPESLSTDGLTRVVLRGRDGLEIGRLKGRDGILWTREGRLASELCGSLGPAVGTLALLQPNWPEERLTFLGPAELELDEAYGRGIEKATAEDGLMVLMAWRFGRLEPFLCIGMGETRLHLRMPGGGPALARGNGGFTLLRELGSERLTGTMGSLERSREQRFEFVSGGPAGPGTASDFEDRFEGRGWLRFEVVARPGAEPDWRLRFDAGLQQELYWQRTEAGAVLRIEGVKSAVLASRAGGSSQIDLEGLPLRFRSSGSELEVRAETCRREGLGPWHLRGHFHPVELEKRDTKRDSRVVLVAREVLLRRLPDPWGTLLLAIHAEGEVDLGTRLGGPAPRLLSLRCDELDYLPILGSPALGEVMASVLGPGSTQLVPELLGNGRGLIEARGTVRLSLTEGPEDARSQRSMEGGYLRLEGDAMASLMLPKPGGTVGIVVAEPGRETITATTDRCRTRGHDIELGRAGGADPVVEIIDGDPSERRFRLVSAAPVLYRSRIDRPAILPADCGEPPGTPVTATLGLLSFPGPVRGRRLEAEPEDRVEVDCRDRLLVQLVSRERSTGPAGALGGRPFLLPHAFDRILAEGEVRFVFQELEAEADRLGFGAGSGWMQLAATGAEPVRVRLGQDFHAACYPSFAYNLWTYEQSAGRFVLRSGTASGKGQGR